MSPLSYVFCLSGCKNFLACDRAISEHANVRRVRLRMQGHNVRRALHQNLLRRCYCVQTQETRYGVLLQLPLGGEVSFWLS